MMFLNNLLGQDFNNYRTWTDSHVYIAYTGIRDAKSHVYGNRDFFNRFTLHLVGTLSKRYFEFFQNCLT